MNYDERLARANEIYDAGLEQVRTTKLPKGQKFKPGTFVWISANLGPTMSHFPNNLPAMVEYTYAHAYGSRDKDSYSLLVRYDDGDWSSVAWYDVNQLSLIKDKNLIQQYKREIGK